ncbi:cation:proton antiporter, partial [Litorivivens sp.]
MSGITTSFFLIFAGAAVVASLALYTRQPLIIAYIVLGALIGPYGMEWVTDLKLLADIADVGILFLLFLLGLDMQPRALIDTIQKSTVVALLSSLLFAATGFSIAYAFGFTFMECLVIGAAMMFSSTIIGIKLLPTTVLHHKHTGELMIGLLLLQDLIAIFVLLLLMALSLGEFNVADFSLTLLSLPLLIAFAFGAVRWVVLPLLRRFDR